MISKFILAIVYFLFNYVFFQPCTLASRNILNCTAPAMEPGLFYIGVLLDAACHLLDLNTTITVHPDPYFEPFEEVLIFSETHILEDNILITIEVHTNNFYINHYYVCIVHSVFHLSF